MLQGQPTLKESSNNFYETRAKRNQEDAKEVFLVRKEHEDL